MTAARIERTPGTKAGELGHQVRIRRPLRDLPWVLARRL
jgi:hypothetical protein